MNSTKKFWPAILIALLAVLVAAFPAYAAPTPCDSTTATVVPGHCDRDGTVTGHYTSLYAYDAYGNWYWDLGDGRVQGTVGSVDDLDQATLSVCNYQNNYRGDFGGDPFMDDGWIMNNINCSGYDGSAHFTYLIVHQSDPRYTGNPDFAIWGTWEYKVLAGTGFGNLVRPDHAVGLD
jgi:hypothetical protein